VQVFPNYACIVSSNDGLHIVHATIADLNCVSVKNFVKFVVRWKMFVNQAEKLRPMLVLTLLLKGGINQMMLRCRPISVWLLWCFFHVA
jgi:hypothetical protein